MLLLENLKKTIQKIAEVLKLKADKTDIVQSDWAQTDVNNKAFIRNKPNITDLTKSTYINLLHSTDDLSSSFWKVSGNITRREIRGSNAEIIIPPHGSIVIESTESFRNLGECRLILKMTGGDYNYKISGDANWNPSPSQASIWEYNRSLVIDNSTYPAGYGIKIEIQSKYQYYLSFQLYSSILYQVNAGKNVTLMPTFTNALKLAPDSTYQIKLTNAIFLNSNVQYEIIPNLYLDLPINVTFLLDQFPGDILPDFMSIKVFLATDGGQITFDSHNIKSAPEGLVMKKLGSYAVILKVGKSYIVRINNPSV